MKREDADITIVEDAVELVSKDRQAMYGHPYDNFTDTAALWSVILGTEITPQQVALCMVQVKIARELHMQKRDNLVDAVGYILTYDAVNKTSEKLDCVCEQGCEYCE